MSSIDDYTSEFVSQFMEEIDSVRKDFKIKNIKYQPFQQKAVEKKKVSIKSKKMVNNLNHLEKQSSMNQKIEENENKMKFHLSHYKSFNPKKILFQIERGQFPRLDKSVSTQKFHPLPNKTQTNFVSPRTDPYNKKYQVTHSQRESVIDLKEQIEQKKSQYHPFNRYENDLEPLHKYDEGQIYNQEKEAEYIEKLRVGNTLIGYTKCTQNNEIEWFACEVERFNEKTKQYLVNVMNRQKWVTRANLLFQDESKEEFDQRFRKARNNRQDIMENKIIQYFIEEQIEKEQVLMHKEFLSKILEFTFKVKSSSKELYICDVIEETVENFKNSVLRFQLEGSKLVAQKQQLNLLRLRRIQVVHAEDKDMHFAENQDYLGYVGTQLDANFHHFGLVHQLKPKNKTEVIEAILQIMEHVVYFEQFRLFKHLRHGQALCHDLEQEYQRNLAELDMHVYKIETIVTKVKTHIAELLNFQVSKLVSVSPFDHTRSINHFEHKQLATFNHLLTSILHLSIKDSFQILLDYYQPYYLLIPFHLGDHLNLYKQRALTLQRLHQNHVENLLITQVKSFPKSPTHIQHDLKLVITIYQDFIRTLYDQKECHKLHSHNFGEIQPFIDLKLKINYNCKKKLKYINIIKFVLIQRQKIYDTPAAMKKLIDDLLKENHEEYSVKLETFQKQILHKEVSAQRLGWFSWKKLKITTQPSLQEVESSFKKVFYGCLDKLYEQNQINSFEQKLRIEETRVHFDKFMDFFEEFLYHQFLGVLGFTLLINQFHFYLSENIFIQSIIEIFEETDNMVLINQEKRNLERDLDLIQNKLPGQVVYGIMRVDTRDVKEQLEGAIRSLQKQMDAAIIAKLESNLQENVVLNQRIYESLNESPTSVGKYIEMMQYINSRELVENIHKIKHNTAICNKLLDTITQFQIPLQDSLFYKYLKQLPFLHNIEEQKKQTVKVLNNCKNQFKKLVDETTDFIQRRFKKLRDDISQFIEEASLEKAKANLMNSKNIEEQLVDLIKKGRQVNEQEQFLEYEPTSFRLIEDELGKFQKYSDLWDLAEKIRYKLESWQNTPFLQLDVHEMIESSREYAYQLMILQQQFSKSQLSEELREQFTAIIVQLISNIKVYDNYFQVLLVLKEVSVREKYYQKVMKQLFKTNDLIELQQISIEDLIERNLESQQDMILELSNKAKSEQLMNQKMIELDNAMKEIQFKTVHIDIHDSAQINYVLNSQAILGMIHEIELEIQNMLDSTVAQLLETVRDKMKFLLRGCNLSEFLLRKIFHLQDVLVDLNPYFKNINKHFQSQNDFLKIKEEQKKRIDNLKRSGVNYFLSMLERGEHDNEELTDSEEVKLYVQKLDDHQATLNAFIDQFNLFVLDLMYHKSQFGLLQQHHVKRMLSNLYSEDTMRWFLLKLFTNISSFNLTNNLDSLKVLSYQNHFDEEFYLAQEFLINWKDGDASLQKLPAIIEDTYRQALHQNIVQYLPIIFDCQYNLNKIYRFLQQHTLYFQVLYVVLSINFYHDLTLRLYHSYIASKAITEFEIYLQDQLEYFIRSQTSKAKTHQTYYQLILLMHNFINILKNFNGSESNDPFFQSKSIHSFEYLSLPKLSLQLGGSSWEEIIKEEVQFFENKEYGLDSPTKKQNKTVVSPYLQHMLNHSSKVEVVLLSFDNKVSYEYQLSRNIEFLAYTPSMEKTFVSLVHLLHSQKAAILSGPVNSGKRSMVEYLCFLTGKRQVEIEFEYSSFEEVGKQLGSIAQAGLWGVFHAEESDVRVVQAISGLYFEIHERLATQQTSVQIEGMRFEVKGSFRLVGTLSCGERCRKEAVPAFSYICIFRLDEEYLVQTLLRLLVPSGDGEKLMHFWRFMRHNLEVIEDTQQRLVVLPRVLQLSLRRLREYLNSNEEVRPMQIVREFVEIAGTHLPIEQRKQVSCFVEDEFKEERQTEERNLFLKQQVEIAKEFKMFNNRMLAYISSFIDQFTLAGKVVVVGHKDKKLLTDLSATVISRLRNDVFQLLIFPMATLTERDLLGYYQDHHHHEGLLDKIQLAQQYQKIINEDNQNIHQKYERNLILQHLIHYPSVDDHKQNHFSSQDWVVIDGPSNPHVFMRQELKMVFWVTELDHSDPTPLPIVFIAEPIHTPHERFQMFVKKLCHKHKFFKSISAHLNCLFYFFALDEQKTHFACLLEILLNEFRKKQIANGFFTYKDFQPKERKVIFDPSSLQLHSAIKPGAVHPDNPIFGANDERIKQMTESLFLYALASSYDKKPHLHKKLLEKIDRYNTYIQQHAPLFQQPFAFNLLQQIQSHALTIFEVSFSLVHEAWVPFQQFSTHNLQLFQRSKRSNILSAMETIRLNPNAHLNKQVNGQYQQELDAINQTEHKMLYNSDYILLLMALAKKTVIISNKKSEFQVADFMQQRTSNRTIKLNFRFKRFPFFEKINPRKMYFHTLENKQQSYLVEIDDFNLEPNVNMNILRQIFKYKAAYINGKVMRVKKRAQFNMFLYTDKCPVEKMPLWMQEKAYFLQYDANNLVEIINVYHVYQNEQMNNIVTSFHLAVSSMNLNLKPFFKLCTQRNIFANEPQQVAQEFIDLYKSLHVYREEAEVVRSEESDSSMNVERDDALEVRMKEEQCFKKNIQYIGLLQRSKDGLMKRCLKHQNLDDVSFIENLKSLRKESRRQDLGEILFHVTFGSVLSDEQRCSIYEKSRGLEVEESVEAMIFEMQGRLRFDKMRTQRMIQLSLGTLEELLEKVMLSVKLKVSTGYWLEGGLGCCEMQGVLEMLQEYFGYSLLFLDEATFSDEKVRDFVASEWQDHKVILVDAKHARILDDVFELAYLGFALNERQSHLSQAHLNYALNKKLQLQVIVTYEGADEQPFVHMLDTYGLFPNWVRARDTEHSIYSNYADRQLFTNASPEFDQVIAGLRLDTPRVKELVYRLHFQVDAFFQRIKAQFHGRSLYSEVLLLLDDKIKAFNQNISKQQEEINFLEDEKVKIARDKLVIQDNIRKQNDELIDNQNLLDGIKDDGDTVSIRNEKQLIAIHSQLKSDIQQLSLINQSALFKQLQAFAVSSENVLLYQEFFLFFIVQGRKPEKIKSYDAFNQIRPLKHNEFLSLFCEQKINFKIKALEQTNFLQLSKETKEYFEHLKEFSEFRPDLINTKALQLIHKIVEQFYDLIAKQDQFADQVVQVQQRIQNTKELIKKIQLDVRITRDNVIQLDKKQVAVSQQVEQYSLRIQKIQQHLQMFQALKDKFHSSIQPSYLAENYLISYHQPFYTSLTFYIALYLVTHQVPPQADIAIKQYIQVLLNQSLLQNTGYYAKILEDQTCMDNQLIRSFGLIHFLVENSIGYLILLDERKVILDVLIKQLQKTITENKQQYEKVVVTNAPNWESVLRLGQTLVLLDPDEKELEFCYALMEKYIAMVSSSYFMKKKEPKEQQPENAKKKLLMRGVSYSNASAVQSSKFSVLIDGQEVLVKESFYLIVYFIDKKPPEFGHPIGHQFIRFNFDQYDNLSAWHQRLVHNFIFQFNSREGISSLYKYKQDKKKMSEKQHEKLDQLKNLLMKSDPSSDEFILPIYKLTFEEFECNLQQKVEAIIQEHAQCITILKNSPQYQQAFMNGSRKKSEKYSLKSLKYKSAEIKERTEQSEEEEGSDSDSSKHSGNPEDSIESASSAESQNSQMDFQNGILKPLDLQLFVNSKFLETQYMFDIQDFNLMGFAFIETISFMLTVKNIFDKLRIPMDMCLDHIKNYKQDLLRNWFTHIILQHGPRMQNVFYFYFGIKYLKLSNEFSSFKYNMLLYGQIQQGLKDVPQVLDRLLGFYEKDLVTQQVFGFKEKNLGQSHQEVHECLLKYRKAQTKQLKVKYSLSVSKAPSQHSQNEELAQFHKRKLSSILMPQKMNQLMTAFQDKLENFDHEEFDRVHLQTMLVNINKGTQLRPSIIRDQSALGQIQFQQQLKRISDAMRQSKVTQFANNNRTFNLSMIHMKSSFIGLTQMIKQQNQSIFESYVVTYFPNKHRQALLTLYHLLGKGYLKTVLENYLSGKSYQKWLQFALLPVSFLRNNILDMKIPLPNSLDIDQVTYLDHLVLAKYLKPSLFHVYVDSFFGQTIMKEFYYAGKHNLYYQSTQQKSVWIEYDSDLENIVRDIVEVEDRYLKIYYCGYIQKLDLSHLAAESKLIIINPECLTNQVDLKLQILSLSLKVYFITSNLNCKSILKRDCNLLFIDQSANFKEYFSYFYQENLKRQIKGEITKKQIQIPEDSSDFGSLNLNSFLEVKNKDYKQHQDLYNIQDFYQKCRFEILYSLYFYISLKMKKQEYTQKNISTLNLKDMRVFVDKLSEYLKWACSHPFVFFYKLTNILFDINTQIDQQHNFYQLQNLMFKQDQNQILITLESQLVQQQIHMYKQNESETTNGRFSSENITQYLSILPEIEPMDLIGLPYYCETQKNYERSQELLECLQEQQKWMDVRKEKKEVKAKCSLENWASGEMWEVLGRRLEKERGESEETLMIYQTAVKEDLQKQRKNCELWLRKFSLSVGRKEKTAESFELDFWIKSAKEKKAGKEGKQKSQVHMLKLQKIIRNTVLNEIKKKKDIKISTKMFTKTLQEQKLKQTDNILQSYFLQDRDSFLVFKLKHKKMTLHRKTLLTEIAIHRRLLDLLLDLDFTPDNRLPNHLQLLLSASFGIHFTKITQLLLFLYPKYHYIHDLSQQDHVITFDLSRLYDPSNLLYSYALTQIPTLNVPLHQIKLKCDRNTAVVNKNDCLIEGLKLKNAFINSQNEHLEDGNTYLEEYPLPMLKLSAVQSESHGRFSLEMADKIHNNLRDEHVKQIEENQVFKEVDFSHYLKKKVDSPRSNLMGALKKQKQNTSNKKIYFIKLPIEFKGKNSLELEFYIKSLQSQHHWIQRHASITN